MIILPAIDLKDGKCVRLFQGITFEPFLKRKELCGLTDAQIGKRFGLTKDTVNAMRLHDEVPFNTVQKICQELHCQPGDIMEALDVWIIPATKEK